MLAHVCMLLGTLACNGTLILAQPIVALQQCASLQQTGATQGATAAALVKSLSAKRK